MQRAHVEGILHMWAHDAHGCSETTVNSWRYNQSGTSNVKGRTPIDNIISYYTSQEAWHGMYAVAKLRRVQGGVVADVRQETASRLTPSVYRVAGKGRKWPHGRHVKTKVAVERAQTRSDGLASGAPAPQGPLARTAAHPRRVRGLAP